MYVRPHLDFCDIIYHRPMITNLFVYLFRLTNQMDKIESIQYQTALVLTDTWKGTNTGKIYDGLAWEPLAERRRFRRLIQFLKTQNDLTREYLKIPDIYPRTHLYDTRSGNAIPPIPYRINTYMNSSFPNTVKEWNKIDPDMRQSASLSIFKSNVLKTIRLPMRSTFNIHDHRH